jgi:hypothetical protein
VDNSEKSQADQRILQGLISKKEEDLLYGRQTNKAHHILEYLSTNIRRGTGGSGLKRAGSSRPRNLNYDFKTKEDSEFMKSDIFVKETVPIPGSALVIPPSRSVEPGLSVTPLETRR